MAKASFNREAKNNGKKYQILEHPEKGWFLLTSRIVTKAQKQVARCESVEGIRKELILLDDYDCMLDNLYRIVLEPKLVQTLNIHSGKISMKNGVKKNKNMTLIRSILETHNLVGFMSIGQTGNISTGTGDIVFQAS